MSTQATLEPVTRAIEVDCSVEHAFTVFTERISSWWPLARHSIGGERAESIRIEPHEGGRLLEAIRGGEECVWGEVTDWDPPQRLAFTWRVGAHASNPTEIEVRFRYEGGRTRVELEHRGWERLGDRAAASRASYVDGWAFVLGEFEGAVRSAETGR